MKPFTLHERLEADTLPVAELELCHVLLMNNRLFPWLILVPKQADISEITELSSADRHRLMDEITTTCRILQTVTGAEKMNIATLGNIVQQLHVHVIARFSADLAWPTPVWGHKTEPYAKAEAEALIAKLQQALNNR